MTNFSSMESGPSRVHVYSTASTATFLEFLARSTSTRIIASDFSISLSVQRLIHHVRLPTYSSNQRWQPSRQAAHRSHPLRSAKIVKSQICPISKCVYVSQHHDRSQKHTSFRSHHLFPSARPQGNRTHKAFHPTVSYKLIGFCNVH